MNTVLLIEPRKIDTIVFLFQNALEKLGDTWKYVFYCGKGLGPYWKSKLPFVEIRPLEVDNLPSWSAYSHVCKNRELWNSLYGDYVLTIQLDTWILNEPPYTIDFFMGLQKSFIGGNMSYGWDELTRDHIHPPYLNFNGGLSLRKRKDMIAVFDTFPPLPTNTDKIRFESDQEDVYFTIGCYKLGFPVGDDEPCSHFAMHTIDKKGYFGVHSLLPHLLDTLTSRYPYVLYFNPYLKK